MFHLSKLFFRISDHNYSPTARGQSGNGANFSHDRSANKACVAGAGQAEVIVSGLFFFGSFLLEKQKK